MHFNPPPYPLAPVQAGMLRGGAVGAGIMQVELVIRREVGAEKVRQAWAETVSTVVALRSGFAFRDGMAMGWLDRPVEGTWQEFPGRGEIDAWLTADRQAALPLENGVPWRVAFWPESGRWVWTFHHALLDGRSITRILRVFLDRLQGTGAPELGPVLWRTPPPESVAEAVAWFESAAAGASAAMPDFGGGPAGTVSASGGQELANTLAKVSLAHDVTPATILIWAWGQVLARASGGETVVLGQVRAGPPVADAAGFSMNTLPVPVRCGGDGPAAETWVQLREHLLALRAWEQVAPEHFPLPSGGNGAPWSSVIMVENGTLFHQLGSESGLAISAARLHEQPGGPLLASAYLQPDLRLEVSADESIGTDGARILLEHWLQIVRKVCARPGGSLQEVTRLPPAMEAQLETWEDGGPALPGPDHLATAWEEARRRFARETAVWTPGESISYQEFGHQADGVADSLTSVGVRAGQTVAVKAGRRSRWPLALIAVLGLGAVYLPLGPRIAAQRLRSMVRQGSPEVLLCCSDLEEDFGLRRVDLDRQAGPDPYVADTLEPQAEKSVIDPAKPGAAAWQSMALLYTSGSTGVPKGVLLEHRGVLNEARWVSQALGLGPGERLLQFSSPGFDASLEEMFSCLLSGATLVPRPEEAAADLALFQAFVEKAGITVLDLPTAFWATWSTWMRETGHTVPPRVRTAIIGGERATARALADWRAAGGRTLWNSYGPTEASIVATAWEIGESWEGAEDPPIGRPLPGYRVRVAGPDGTTLPPGAAGEIWIGGPPVGPGYLGQDELTAAAFVERDGLRWYRTGDQARWDPEGRLRFLGRRDDQLKIRGHRIEPGEIVRLLEQVPGVAAAHAGLWEAASPAVMAAWVRWEGEPPDHWPHQLRQYLEPRLPAAALPVRWAAVETFLLTERGKLDRRALPEPEALHHQTWEAPETLTEQRFAARWETLLGVSRIGRQDSFFDLGGHSLAALQFFSWLRTECGTPLPMTTLFNHPTLAGLALAVDESLAQPPPLESHAPLTSQVVMLRESRSGRPLFCVHGGDGGVFFYQDLASCLPEHLGVATIEAPALGATGPVEFKSVEDAARGYVAAIRQIQPEGPYHLAGYSFGGVVVYEMAAQLRKAGESVAFVGLFDTENPACRWRRYRLWERLAVFWQAGGTRPWWQRSVRLVARIVSRAGFYLPSRLQLWAARRQRTSAPYSHQRAVQVREAHTAAMECYQPPPLDVPVVLFRTQAADDRFAVDPDYGWSQLTPTLDLVDCNGEHLTMFSKAHVPALAQSLAARLPA